jgi:hypothetical protein
MRAAFMNGGWGLDIEQRRSLAVTLGLLLFIKDGIVLSGKEGDQAETPKRP